MGLLVPLTTRVSEASRRFGLRLCALGWHRRPLEEMPRPPGVPKVTYQLNPRYRCGRCGLAGRKDSYGNLDEHDEDPYATGLEPPGVAGDWRGGGGRVGGVS